MTVETWHQMKVRHLNERIAAITAQCDQGKSAEEAAQALGMARASIYEFNRNHSLGLQFRDDAGTTKVNEEVLAARIALSKKSLTIHQAAARLGLDVGSLRQYSARHDINWKPASSWIMAAE